MLLRSLMSEIDLHFLRPARLTKDRLLKSHTARIFSFYGLNIGSRHRRDGWNVVSLVSKLVLHALKRCCRPECWFLGFKSSAACTKTVLVEGWKFQAALAKVKRRAMGVESSNFGERTKTWCTLATFRYLANNSVEFAHQPSSVARPQFRKPSPQID